MNPRNAVLLFVWTCGLIAGCGQPQPCGCGSQGATSKPATASAPAGGDFRSSFSVPKANWTATGANPYFVLKPGHRLTLRSGADSLIITVLDETRLVDGVTTRVVEERETENGQLKEVSRNYFALDGSTGDLYYFGEEVDMYKDGKVASHEGAWLSGVNGAKFGLMLPGAPKVGDRYYQELAPKVAMDRGEVLSLSEEMTTPAGTFKNVLCTRDSSAIESGSEKKYFAPGVGLLKDGDFILTEVSPAK